MTEVQDEVLDLSLKAIIKSLLHYIDYNQLDLLRFLSLKDHLKYKFWTTIKILLFTAFLISYIVGFFSPLEFMFYCILVHFILVIAYIIINNKKHLLFKYSITYYRIQRNILLKYWKKLSLIINHQYIFKIIKNEENKELEQTLENINKKILTFSEVFKPYSLVLNQYKVLIGIVLTFLYFLLGFFFEYPIFEIGFYDIGIISLVLFWFIYFAFSGVKKRYYKDKKLLKYLEEAIDSQLHLLSLYIKLKQFPDEAKAIDTFKKIFDKINSKLKTELRDLKKTIYNDSKKK